mgnify:CR=1 FL=1
MKVSKKLLKRLLQERGEVSASDVVRFKPQVRDIIELMIDELAMIVPKLGAVSERRYKAIVDVLTTQTVSSLVNQLGYEGGQIRYEGKEDPQGLSECFLPNLPYAPMPIKSLAPKAFQDALKGVLAGVSNSDEELKCLELRDKIGNVMVEIDGSFGLGGEDDPRVYEAFEYLYKATERLMAVYELRD